MTRLVFHVAAENLPAVDVAGTSHVLLYGARPPRVGSGSIGGTLEEAVMRLGIPVDPASFDFLSIALAIVAADTFVSREEFSSNGWARELALDIPLARPATWAQVAPDLERALRFLSGDVWTLTFREGGTEPPSKQAIRRLRKFIGIGPADCVCLFSGGLDSLLGAWQLIDDRRTPLLISHSYRGDQSYQNYLAPRLGKVLPRFAANAHPVFSGNRTDTSMRTRSLGFLAYGVVGVSALLAKKPCTEPMELFIPENGFIALNAPLTRRRVGSLSTRTTHPSFLGQMEAIFDKVGLNVRLQNEFRHRTKGEMLLGMKPGRKNIALKTVSCGKWKRKNQQCGHCVPCLIRRASFAKAGIVDATPYQYTVEEAWNLPDLRDDILAMLLATSRSKRGLRQRAIASGPLPFDTVERARWFGVYERGLDEVRAYLESQGLGT